MNIVGTRIGPAGPRRLNGMARHQLSGPRSTAGSPLGYSLRSGGGMRIGVVFPQTELGGDAGAVRAWAQRAEELGFTHVLAYDHVVGADPAVHKGWDGPYELHTTFHEPMVLYGYLAAVTSMELVTGVIILPQRQTVLVAKQAAEGDLVTGGKFRLGVGIGWERGGDEGRKRE